RGDVVGARELHAAAAEADKVLAVLGRVELLLVHGVAARLPLGADLVVFLDLDDLGELGAELVPPFLDVLDGGGLNALRLPSLLFAGLLLLLLLLFLSFLLLLGVRRVPILLPRVPRIAAVIVFGGDLGVPAGRVLV